jgi:hypothetical protein
LEISANYITIALFALWVISLSLWFYLLKIALPRTRRHLEEDIPDMVWQSILERLRDTQNPETQEVFNRTAIYMLKAVSTDKDFRNVLNGKFKEFASTFAKFFISALPPQAQAYLQASTGSGGGAGGINPDAMIQKIFGKIVDSL